MPLKTESLLRSEYKQTRNLPERNPTTELSDIGPGLPTGEPKLPKRKRVVQHAIPVRKRRKPLTRCFHGWLTQPIAYDSWTKANELPFLKEGPEIGELFKELALIQIGASAFIPKMVKDNIWRGDFGYNHFTDSNLLDDQRPSETVQDEFMEFDCILKSQESLLYSAGNESTWHAQVWSRILYCAVDLQVDPLTSWESVVTAQIGGQYLPYLRSPDDKATGRTPNTSRSSPRRTVKSKVDYAVTIIPTAAEQQAISKVIDTRCEAGLPATINHASGLELRYQPIAVSIATRSGKQDSTERLGIWSAAWFTSMEPLVSQLSLTKGKASPDWMPLIAIDATSWCLLLAINDVDSNKIIVTKSPGELGNTQTTVEAYKLLACLRVLLRWADGTYRAWWDQMLGISTST